MVSARRTRRASLIAAGVSASVLMAVAVGVPSCRDLSTTPVTSAGAPAVRYIAGDSLTFERYAIGSFGYEIANTRRTVLWAVISVSDVFAGAGGVTTIVQTVQGDTLAPPPDTLRFRFLDNGDIERYGYLSSLALRRDSTVLAPQWDRIAALSLGMGGRWTLGAVGADSTDVVEGNVTDYQDYFTLTVNGESRIVPSTTIALSATVFYAEVSISQNPGSIVRMVVNATPSGVPGEVFKALTLRSALPR
jgi:hypothetical protein